MVRVRRLRPRIPIGKLYELEYRPNGDPDAGFHGITRSPVDYLAPVLGSAAAAAAVREADRQWDAGSTHWVREWDEDERPVGDAWDPRDDGVMPRVGWWLLVPHLVLLVVGAWSYLYESAGSRYDDNGMAEGITYVIFLVPLGLPWSVVAFFAVPALNSTDDGPSPNNDPEILALVLVPAVLNLVLHVLYRWRRHRSVQSFRRGRAST